LPCRALENRRIGESENQREAESQMPSDPPLGHWSLGHWVILIALSGIGCIRTGEGLNGMALQTP